MAATTSPNFSIKPSPSKGLGAFATKSFLRGSTVFQEAPIFSFEQQMQDITEQDLRTAYSQLSTTDQHTFNGLRSPAGGQASIRLKFAANVFYHGSTTGCYVLSSRFNNSCQPNCISINHHGQNRFKALENISPGEELTFSYGEPLQFMTTTERGGFLRPLFGGRACSCKLCSLPPSSRRLSDLRRELLRRLLAKIRGQDLEGVVGIVGVDTHRPTDHQVLFDLIVFAILLFQAEGVRQGGIQAMLYASALKMFIIRAHATKRDYIPKKNVLVLLEWMDSWRDIVRISGEDPEVDEVYRDCREWMARVKGKGLPSIQGLPKIIQLFSP